MSATGSAPRPTAPYLHRLRVRYAETDQMGVVHHGSYVLYLEEARTRMMADDGMSYAALERAGIGLAVRRVELRYRLPAYYEEELVIATRVERVRAASVLLAYEVRRDAGAGDELVADGSSELACVDLRHKPAPPRVLPDELRAAFEARIELGRGAR
ncbi:MAG: acyl-CoA thioesterase [Planctomycetota bacterium]|nr:MAG: acyl-CoA thioesterase [Planctomycetota bacterium]